MLKRKRDHTSELRVSRLARGDEKTKRRPLGRTTEVVFRVRPKCAHGRRKDSCIDCGTGYCKHRRLRYKCKDCGTGYCVHGRRKNHCIECDDERYIQENQKDVLTLTDVPEETYPPIPLTPYTYQ